MGWKGAGAVELSFSHLPWAKRGLRVKYTVRLLDPPRSGRMFLSNLKRVADKSTMMYVCYMMATFGDPWA